MVYNLLEALYCYKNVKHAVLPSDICTRVLYESSVREQEKRHAIYNSGFVVT